MLTVQIPLLLALLGTALMAVVIFAPSRIPAPLTASFAPPSPPPAVDRWDPPSAGLWEPATERCEAPPVESWQPPPEPLAPEAPPPAHAPLWPMLVDPSALACDATARLAIAEALATVRAPWADAILRRALDDETDSSVRDAVTAALGPAAGPRSA